MTGAVPVSPDRRARVEQAIAELGYVPDERARDLRRATTRTVGIMVPSLGDPLAAEVFQRLHRALRREGATVLLHESHDSRDAERLAVDALLRAHARAVVVSAARGLGADSTHLLRRRDVRVVYFGDRPPDASQMSVGVDDYGGSRALTEHLLKLGHRRIGYLSGRLDGSTGSDRRDGSRVGAAHRGHRRRSRADRRPGDDGGRRPGHDGAICSGGPTHRRRSSPRTRCSRPARCSRSASAACGSPMTCRWRRSSSRTTCATSRRP